MVASATRALPSVSPPRFEGPEDALTRGRATFAGTPDQLVEALLDIRRNAGVPVEFVARSHFPMLGYEAQVDLMSRNESRLANTPLETAAEKRSGSAASR